MVKEYMLSNISKALNEGQFSSDIYLSLDGLQVDDDKLLLTIIVTDDNDEKLQEWEVTCTGLRNHKLDVNFFEEFEVLDEHIFLWEFNYNTADLFFKGNINDINGVIGELFIIHSNLAKGQIPLEKYLNINYYNVDIRHLLSQGEGLFSKGPVNLIKVYEKVLSENGYKTSIIEYPTKGSTVYKIFVFGDSYVVAKDFQAFQVL
ncbi:hypothetical protein [Neobacillus sp. DY30]|uniref:hypothetical protein n=1 Tax=Neobacillus sp. DY30 TaxID=3047871 RepID=UPI0024C000A6|nr:hypothetical protein [Neobacillus sp. DY30]WHY02582.1 hypothetical protein QNH29_10295 [Neobacillus sp. DY30]